MQVRCNLRFCSHVNWTYGRDLFCICCPSRRVATNDKNGVPVSFRHTSMALLESIRTRWQYQGMSRRIQQLMDWVQDIPPPSSSPCLEFPHVTPPNHAQGKCPPSSLISSSIPPFCISDPALTTSHLTELFPENSNSRWKRTLLASTPLSSTPPVAQSLFLWGSHVGLAVLHEREYSHTGAGSTSFTNDVSSSVVTHHESGTRGEKEGATERETRLRLPVTDVQRRWEQALVKDVLPFLYFFTIFPHHHYHNDANTSPLERVNHSLSPSDPILGSSPDHVATNPVWTVSFSTHCLVLQWILYTWGYTLCKGSFHLSEHSSTAASPPWAPMVVSQLSAASNEIRRTLMQYRNTVDMPATTTAQGERRKEENSMQGNVAEEEKRQMNIIIAQMRQTHEDGIDQLLSIIPSACRNDQSSSFSSPFDSTSEGVRVGGNSEPPAVTRTSGLVSCIRAYLLHPEAYLLSHHSSLSHITQPFIPIEKDNERIVMHAKHVVSGNSEEEWVQHVNTLLSMTALSDTQREKKKR